jgi:hypothetical protein
MVGPARPTSVKLNGDAAGGVVAPIIRDAASSVGMGGSSTGWSFTARIRGPGGNGTAPAGIRQERRTAHFDDA